MQAKDVSSVFWQRKREKKIKFEQRKSVISYEDMQIEIGRTHVRRNLTSESREMFPIFKTSMGWLGQKLKTGTIQEDITGELGVAVMIYFK